MEAYIGTIIAFAGEHVPSGWLECQGQSLSVNEYSVLYSVLKNSYGGNSTNFNLPDLRGRVIMGVREDPSGVLSRDLGVKYGADSMTLNYGHLPPHNHSFWVASNLCDRDVPDNNSMFGKWTGSAPVPDSSGNSNTDVHGNSFTATPTNRVKLSDYTIGTTGSNQSFDIVQPSLVCRYIICVQGFFPPRQTRLLLEDAKREIIVKKPVIHTGHTMFQNSSARKLEVEVVHNQNLPTGQQCIQLTVRNREKHTDVFAVSIKGDSVTSNGFTVVVVRVDGEGWGQVGAVLMYTITAYE